MSKNKKPRTPDEVVKSHKHIPHGVNDRPPAKPKLDDTVEFLGKLDKPKK